MPTSPPTAPLHRILGIGLTTLVVVFLALRYLNQAPVTATDDVTPVIGYTLSGLAFTLLAVSLLLLKPRVPERRPSQSIEQFWSTPDVNTKVMMVWFLMEGAGVISAVSYFLTGAAASAAVMVLALAVFWMNGPGSFGK